MTTVIVSFGQHYATQGRHDLSSFTRSEWDEDFVQGRIDKKTGSAADKKGESAVGRKKVMKSTSRVLNLKRCRSIDPEVVSGPCRVDWTEESQMLMAFFTIPYSIFRFSCVMNK